MKVSDGPTYEKDLSDNTIVRRICWSRLWYRRRCSPSRPQCWRGQQATRSLAGKLVGRQEQAVTGGVDKAASVMPSFLRRYIVFRHNSRCGCPLVESLIEMLHLGRLVMQDCLDRRLPLEPKPRSPAWELVVEQVMLEFVLKLGSFDWRVSKSSAACPEDRRVSSRSPCLALTSSSCCFQWVTAALPSLTSFTRLNRTPLSCTTHRWRDLRTTFRSRYWVAMPCMAWRRSVYIDVCNCGESNIPWIGSTFLSDGREHMTWCEIR